MKKLILFFLSIFFLVITFIFFLKYYNTSNFILEKIEKETGLKIELIDKGQFNFFPSLRYKNDNIKISMMKDSLEIDKASIKIKKNYWPRSSFIIEIKSSIMNYNGIEIRNIISNVEYINNLINILNLEGEIIEGNIKLHGKIEFNNNDSFNFNGKFSNISLNTLLVQSQIAKWQRVNIKLSSSNFNIKGKKIKNENSFSSLEGFFPITGSLYFTSTDEERFGAALLSILVEKIPSLFLVSESVDYILSTFANIPSTIEGVIFFKNNLFFTKNVIISNKYGKSSIEGEYNYKKNIINGNVYFYKKNEVFLEASLKGSIENPQILVGGKLLSDQEIQPKQDIKKLLEEGISSFIDKLLKTN